MSAIGMWDWGVLHSLGVHNGNPRLFSAVSYLSDGHSKKFSSKLSVTNVEVPFFWFIVVIKHMIFCLLDPFTPRVKNFKFLLQPHKNIASQDEELGFS